MVDEAIRVRRGGIDVDPHPVDDVVELTTARARVDRDRYPNVTADVQGPVHREDAPLRAIEATRAHLGVIDVRADVAAFGDTTPVARELHSDLMRA